MDGRSYVIPDDVKSVVYECLAHRIILKLEYEIEGARTEEVVKDAMESVEVPKGDWR